MILIYSCKQGNTTSDKQTQKARKAKPSLKDDIIGDWIVDNMYAGIDTDNIAKFPDINLEANLSFYNNGRFRKKYSYTDKNQQEKIASYMSDYKVKGDTLFVYEPIIKHWYALYAIMSTKNKMEIGNGKGYAHLDTHYYFGRIGK